MKPFLSMLISFYTDHPHCTGSGRCMLLGCVQDGPAWVSRALITEGSVCDTKVTSHFPREKLSLSPPSRGPGIFCASLGQL